MIRTQVQRSDEQSRALKETAAARGVSIAEVIRQALDQHLGGPPVSPAGSGRFEPSAATGRVATT